MIIKILLMWFWRLLPKFPINANGAIWWPNFQLMQVAPQKALLTEDSGDGEAAQDQISN